MHNPMADHRATESPQISRQLIPGRIQAAFADQLVAAGLITRPDAAIVARHARQTGLAEMDAVVTLGYVTAYPFDADAERDVSLTSGRRAVVMVGCRPDVHGLLDRPDGLLLVANDYILKPFQPAMMCGRIRAVFTRRRLVAA